MYPSLTKDLLCIWYTHLSEAVPDQSVIEAMLSACNTNEDGNSCHFACHHRHSSICSAFSTLEALLHHTLWKTVCSRCRKVYLAGEVTLPPCCIVERMCWWLTNLTPDVIFLCFQVGTRVSERREPRFGCTGRLPYLQTYDAQVSSHSHSVPKLVVAKRGLCWLLLNIYSLTCHNELDWNTSLTFQSTVPSLSRSLATLFQQHTT